MKLARLAGLMLSEEEAAVAARDLGRILDYLKKISELDTDGVPPTSHPLDLSCPLREDGPELRILIDPREAVESSTASRGGHYTVPLVVDPEGE